jgi:hypothetical protein
MASFDASTANIDTTSEKAKPAVWVWPKAVVCHLTRGYSGDNDTETINPAINFNGRVNATGGEKDWTGWRFAFIQLHKVHQMGFWYAGKRPADGGIGIIVNKPPALTKDLCLDSEDAFKPWTRADDHYFFEGKARNFSTDHPACRAKRDLPNTVTSRMNYLFHIVDRRELWTVFTVRDPAGKFQHLAHVRWKLEYNFQFRWRNDKPEVATDSSSFTVDAFKKGAPTDSELTPLLEKPEPPLANPSTRAAITAAVLGGPPNRTDLDRRFANVPFDFYA